YCHPFGGAAEGPSQPGKPDDHSPDSAEDDSPSGWFKPRCLQLHRATSLRIFTIACSKWPILPQFLRTHGQAVRTQPRYSAGSEGVESVCCALGGPRWSAGMRFTGSVHCLALECRRFICEPSALLRCVLGWLSPQPRSPTGRADRIAPKMERH